MDLDALRTRSLELNSQYDEESLSVHQQLLDADPNNPAAHNRVGITLFKLGRLEEAEAVLAAAPETDIAARQLERVRKEIAKPPKPAAKKKAAAKRKPAAKKAAAKVEPVDEDETLVADASEDSDD